MHQPKLALTPHRRATSPQSRSRVALALLALGLAWGEARARAPAIDAAEPPAQAFRRAAPPGRGYPAGPDSDGDGVPDHVEDKDQDGVVDPGESDPHRAGLFPGGRPHIPEPLVFDLVRGLGARRGELEANNLAVLDPETRQLRWAPEIEWAFADGYAVELEIPMQNQHLEALKLALQGTLPGGGEGFIHGWQVFGEWVLPEDALEVVGVYIAGQRFAPRWSWLGMIGGRPRFEAAGAPDAVAGLLNASVFYDLREWNTWGFESNLQWRGVEGWQLDAYPQTHLQLNRHLRVQLSAGLTATPERVGPLFAARIIVE